MTIDTIDEALAYLSRDSKAECAAVLANAKAELTHLRSMTQCSMGVGDGSGNLHVHGDYESIKAAQRFVFAVERARALVENWRADVAHRRGPTWDGRLENGGDGRGPAFDRAILMMCKEFEAALSGKDGK